MPGKVPKDGKGQDFPFNTTSQSATSCHKARLRDYAPWTFSPSIVPVVGHPRQRKVLTVWRMFGNPQNVTRVGWCDEMWTKTSENAKYMNLKDLEFIHWRFLYIHVHVHKRVINVYICNDVLYISVNKLVYSYICMYKFMYSTLHGGII